MLLLLGSAGTGSALPQQRAAAAAALGGLMADAAEILHSCVMEQLEPLLDRTAHDAVRNEHVIIACNTMQCRQGVMQSLVQ